MAVQEHRTRPAQFVEDLGQDLATQDREHNQVYQLLQQV